ncbi:c-type cytochrome [Pedobacter sp. HMF7056]|uniref:C-type cytochrome n=2 Tax=Hufsiella ginkgonis TaxID=2695274 RepID=A0A7K1Y4L5_9SPHI|nr:c-type cytochrome [Hufsiella ginkgonis]
MIALITIPVAGSFAQTPKKKVIPVKKPATQAATAADIKEGEALMMKSDCFACHKVDVKLVGPAYKDVAKKYPATAANYTILAKKILAGGSGVWGQIPMAAHPQITQADATKMVKYILSLK